MLYLFHGTDTSKSVDKAYHLFNSLKEKKPDAVSAIINSDNWSKSSIQEYLGGQGLFFSKCLILLDRICEDVSARDDMLEFVVDMTKSENIFIILEGKLLADTKKVLEKYANKVSLTDIREGVNTKKKDFNIFSLADALGSRDGMKAWQIFRQAMDNGIEAENIVGTMFWQMKSIAMAKEYGSAAEAGLNPFVYGKSKKFASKYSSDELQATIRELLTIYHDAHRGIGDATLALERFCLGL